MLFPLHVDNDHWSLAVANVQQSNITCYNSCPVIVTHTQQMAVNGRGWRLEIESTFTTTQHVYNLTVRGLDNNRQG